MRLEAFYTVGKACGKLFFWRGRADEATGFSTTISARIMLETLRLAAGCNLNRRARPPELEGVRLSWLPH